MKKFIKIFTISLIATLATYSSGLSADFEHNTHDLDSLIQKYYTENRFRNVLKVFNRMHSNDFCALSANSLKSVGNSYYAIKRYDSAEYLYHMTLGKADSDYLKHILSSNLGLVTSKVKNYDRSEYWYKQAFKYPEFLNEDLYLKYGNLLLHSRKYDSSIYYLNKSLALIQQNEGQSSIKLFEPLLNLAHIYSQKAEFEKANLLIDHCLALIKDTVINCQQKYEVLYIKGAVNLRSKQYHQVISIYKEVLHLIDSCNLNEKRSSCLSNIGSAYLYLKNFDSAGYYFDQSLTYLNKVYSLDDISLLHNYGNYLMLAKNDYSGSINYYKRASAILSQYFNEYHINQKVIYACVGDGYLRKKELDSTVYFYQKALKTEYPEISLDDLSSVPAYKSVPNKSTLDILFRKISAIKNLLEKQYSESLAMALLNNAEAFIEGYELLLTQKLFLYDQLNSMQSKLRWVADIGIKTARQLASDNSNMQFFDKALNYSEMAKCLIIKSNMTSIYGDNTPLASFQKERNQLKRQTNRIYYEQLQTDAPAFKDSINRNLAYLSYKFDSLLNQKPGNIPTPLSFTGELSSKNIRNDLNKSTVILNYYLQKDYLNILVLSKDTLIWKRKQIDSAFYNSVEKFKNFPQLEASFNSGSTKHYLTSTHQLYNLLIPPDVLNEEVDNIIIVPDDILNLFPFEILLTEAVQPHEDFRSLPYLIRDYNISYRFSISNDKHLQNAANGRILAIAPEFHNHKGKDYTSIFEAGTEAESLIHLYEGEYFIPKVGFDQDFEERLKDYGILHFATHSKVDEKDPLDSQLILSDNETVEKPFLRASDICNLKINADLVVINACESGKGQLLKGEGVISLAWAFFYAGCPSITMSLNKLDDKSAKIIIQKYYHYLARGLSKDKALRLAKLDYLQSCKPSKSHPAFWAGLVTIGDQNPVNLQKREEKFHIHVSIGLAGIILLLSFIFLQMKGKLRKRSAAK